MGNHFVLVRVGVEFAPVEVEILDAERLARVVLDFELDPTGVTHG